ncbi:pectate lyase [Desarmillaria tabescens]|uniref:Pectate lyase n=1 Tax=Armillaria tabescens TaxID=1929756 RepID=A0AA39K7B7_ARMTA|nr:pectate lyase [Desarmillaria tabescens]KAK0455712.1 pectate lyase [Desarmillaria tabescens]
MKWIYSLLIFVAVNAVSATPLENKIFKRASVSDVATVGYATLNGGTTGGRGGPTTTVTTLDALTSAVTGNSPKIVIISGKHTFPSTERTNSHTTLAPGTLTGNTVVKVALNGIGLRVLSESNVIIRNIKISKVLASAGDALGVQSASQVWLDHLDLSSDRDHDKDFYDGLLDITHGCTGVTVTNSKLYTHWKASLVFDDNNDGINTRDGAQLLVENNVWTGTDKPLYATDEGFAVSRGNDFGPDGADTAPVGNFNTAPYSYTLLPTANVRASVTASAGQTLTF